MASATLSSSAARSSAFVDAHGPSSNARRAARIASSASFLRAFGDGRDALAVRRIDQIARRAGLRETPAAVDVHRNHAADVRQVAQNRFGIGRGTRGRRLHRLYSGCGFASRVSSRGFRPRLRTRSRLVPPDRQRRFDPNRARVDQRSRNQHAAVEHPFAELEPGRIVAELQSHEQTHPAHVDDHVLVTGRGRGACRRAFVRPSPPRAPAGALRSAR